MLDFAQQQSRVVLPARNDNNGQGCPQGGRAGNIEVLEVEKMVIVMQAEVVGN